MKHANISVFVPHLGCPNDCSFCNQRHITGKVKEATADDVDTAVKIALKSPNYNPANTEIAFFGGSFTAIDRNYMLLLLNAAFKYVKNGSVFGIRISTRPDFIDEEILQILKEYGVTAIELGAQSMIDKVLLLNNRGHLAGDVEKASKMIKAFGFELGLQMMTGLYGDNDDGAVYSAKKIIELKPDTVRIYPTIVLKNTQLAKLYESGEYKPQDLDSAVALSVKLKDLFSENGIKVIRTGLHSIESESYLAGPWHPAFSELCESCSFYNRITSVLKEKGNYEIYVNPTDISKAIGNKKNNLNRLISSGYNVKFVQSSEIEKNSFKIGEVKNSDFNIDSGARL